MLNYSLSPPIPPGFEEEAIKIASCGFPELENLMRDNLCVAWAMAASSAGHDLQFLQLQLFLLDLAISAHRSKVDKGRTVGARKGEALRDAASFRDSRSQSESTTEACSWSHFSATQHGQRESEGHGRTQLTENRASDFNLYDQSYDRSRVQSSSWTYGHGVAQTRVDSDSASSSVGNAARRSGSFTGTNGMAPRSVLNISYPEFSPGDIFGGVDVAPGDIDCDVQQIREDAPCPTDPEDTCRPDIPSYGRECEGHIIVTLSVAVVGFNVRIALRSSFSQNFRQTFVCTCAAGQSQSESNDYAALHALRRAWGQSIGAGSQQGSIDRDVARVAESQRTGQRRSDASGATRDESRAERRNGSDSSRHSQTETTAGSESERTSKATVDESGYQTKRLNAEDQRLSQIFEALMALQQRLRAQIMRISHGRFALVGSTSGYMNPLCLPIHYPIPCGVSHRAAGGYR